MKNLIYSRVSMFRKLLTTLPFIFFVLAMQSCGGGTAGDADKNVERSIFAVGDVFETVEDGGALEGDVSSNDIGENLLFAVAAEGGTWDLISHLGPVLGCAARGGVS